MLLLTYDNSPNDSRGSKLLLRTSKVVRTVSRREQCEQLRYVFNKMQQWIYLIRSSIFRCANHDTAIAPTLFTNRSKVCTNIFTQNYLLITPPFPPQLWQGGCEYSQPRFGIAKLTTVGSTCNYADTGHNVPKSSSSSRGEARLSSPIGKTVLCL
jgi:hypothetical protein